MHLSCFPLFAALTFLHFFNKDCLAVVHFRAKSAKSMTILSTANKSLNRSLLEIFLDTKMPI